MCKGCWLDCHHIKRLALLRQNLQKLKDFAINRFALCKSILANCLICCFVWLLGLESGWARTLMVNRPFSDHHRYCYGLLETALKYHGNKYTLKNRDDAMQAQAREVEELNDGKVSVIWIATSIDFEEKLLPIRVPLYKGLLGYRIFIIRKGEQDRFDRVQSLDDLRAILLGQGRGWTDTAVLQAN